MTQDDLKIIKKVHLWTSEEKMKYMGYGEWVEEADIIEFEFLAYHAVVMRIMKVEPFAKEESYFGGHLCGYVKIPEGHPYFNMGEFYDLDLDCHGGITFNEVHEEHWVGFDCGHLRDIVPTTQRMKNTIPELIELRKMLIPPEGFNKLSLFNPVYRNMGYCIEECKSMIKQLIDISVSSIKKGTE